MALFNERFQVGTPASARPYIPSFAAPEELIGKPDEVRDPGVFVSNGKLTGACNGGVISLGGDIWGIDLVAAQSDGTVLEISPTEKGCVYVDKPESGIGAIVGEGAIILSNWETGLLVVSGIMTANRWLAEDASVNGSRVTQIGNRWVVQSDFAQRAEVQDTFEAGEVLARMLPS